MKIFASFVVAILCNSSLANENEECDCEILQLHFIEDHKKLMYCCNYCGYASNTTNIIRRHVSHVHEGVKEHVCQICSLEFIHKKSLIAHIARVHNPDYANVDEIEEDIDLDTEIEIPKIDFDTAIVEEMRRESQLLEKKAR